MPKRKKNKTNLFYFERRARKYGYVRIVGIDEVGRGPLAGPVVAGAVSFPDAYCTLPLADSKTLTAAAREEIASELRQIDGIQIGIGVVDSAEVDRINILRASHLAMKIALSELDPQPEFALIDGLKIANFPIASEFIVKGDGRSASIAAASIVAKVHRDQLMLAYHAHFPVYGFAQHKGYATKVHLDALREHGPCAIHRRSFRPVLNPEDLQLQLPFIEEGKFNLEP